MILKRQQLLRVELTERIVKFHQTHILKRIREESTKISNSRQEKTGKETNLELINCIMEPHHQRKLSLIPLISNNNYILRFRNQYSIRHQTITFVKRAK